MLPKKTQISLHICAVWSESSLSTWRNSALLAIQNGPEKILIDIGLDNVGGASNEYPQHMFSCRNKKDISIFRMKKVPYQLLCICAVWSESSLSKWRNSALLAIQNEPSEDSD